MYIYAVTLPNKDGEYDVQSEFINKWKGLEVLENVRVKMEKSDKKAHEMAELIIEEFKDFDDTNGNEVEQVNLEINTVINNEVNNTVFEI